MCVGASVHTNVQVHAYFYVSLLGTTLGLPDPDPEVDSDPNPNPRLDP